AMLLDAGDTALKLASGTFATIDGLIWAWAKPVSLMAGLMRNPDWPEMALIGLSCACCNTPLAAGGGDCVRVWTAPVASETACAAENVRVATIAVLVGSTAALALTGAEVGAGGAVSVTNGISRVKLSPLPSEGTPPASDDTEVDMMSRCCRCKAIS